ncbi:MAG: FAD-dependent oxidoreductase, partial [Pirellulales bacterium]|nr:FAD-dependent oxidoreductase [Pirellulales bacterium]
MKRATLFSIMICVTAQAHAEDKVYDLVIYGPTSAAVAAAVQAKRMGKSVIIVGPDKHLGGLSSGGLGWTDSGNKAVIGGISREFYQRVRKYYDDPKTWKWQKPSEYNRYREGEDAQWTFEPHIAERVFEDLVREYKIPVVRDEWLDRAPGKGVAKKDGRISAINMLSGNTYRGKMFMDATYEGDLMAAAGVTYTTGREANSKYDETLNGVQIANARKHQFRYKISAYKVPGDPKSGLVAR